MPWGRSVTEILCHNQQETEQVAAAIAARASAGDLFALTGDLGAGKSTFARAFIRSALDNPEAEVPSPTFTLIQSYRAECEIHHTDLYRLNDPDEVYDLGLDDDLDAAILLVEWPDRMPQDWWDGALEIELKREGATTDAGDEARRLTFKGDKGRWAMLLAELD